MSTTMMRIGKDEHSALKELAKRTGQPMQRVLSAAIQEYQRKLFWIQVNAGFNTMRADPKAAKEDQDERRAWDATLADDLEGD
jgi:hypothetical protein